MSLSTTGICKNQVTITHTSRSFDIRFRLILHIKIFVRGRFQVPIIVATLNFV